MKGPKQSPSEIEPPQTPAHEFRQTKLDEEVAWLRRVPLRSTDRRIGGFSESRVSSHRIPTESSILHDRRLVGSGGETASRRQVGACGKSAEVNGIVKNNETRACLMAGLSA